MPISKVDVPDERHAIRPSAQQVGRTTSAQPFAKSSTHSAPPLNQPGISMSPSLSPSLSRMAPAITKPTSSRMHTARGILSGEHHSQSGGFHPDISWLPEQGKGKLVTYPDEQGHTDPSDASPRPPLSPEPAITRAEPSFLPQPESDPHRLGRSKSRIRIQGNEGVKRDATGVAEPPTLEEQRKQTAAAEERGTHREDSTTNAYGGSHQMPEPTHLGRHAQHVKRNPQHTSEGSVERTYSSLTRESDSSSVRLPDASKSRGKPGRPSDSTTSLDRTEIPVTLHAPLSTHNQPKHVTGVLSNNSSTTPGVAHRPQTPNTADPIMPSKSMRSVGQLRSAAVTPAAQDGSPRTRVLREIGSETSLRLAGSYAGNSGEAYTSSHAQVDLTHETGENGPRFR